MYEHLYERAPDELHPVVDEFVAELENVLGHAVREKLTRKALSMLLFHFYNGHSVGEVFTILINGHGDTNAHFVHEYAGLVQESRELIHFSG